ncbi:hypothetical protein BS50DRAFT_672620 [Corynespora cassiicola Philippines]|uniref:Zn(2)-C6 fungal-type domain-containing protein n=1 Tax=Corynespora cassiicola Philippines TaxID=1448308 RepID=A0A2T2P2V2_CORCC|nr:hypothetical protein BS50DRAFT_672620 [Corynespora cassiicola Philippines]
MEYDTARRHSHTTPFAYPHYYYNDRNLSLQSHGREARVYPMGGPVGGQRVRNIPPREDGAVDNGSSRRRSAVACARCRKRKIKCSGDPGNGSVCQNCKLAGVNVEVCQFHRVGSTAVTDAIAIHQLNGLTGLPTPNVISPFGMAEGTMYQRSQYGHMDSRTTYPSSWTAITYPEDTSPVDTYDLDHQTSYLPTQGSLGSICGSYRWHQSTSRALNNGNNGYVAPEHTVPSVPAYAPANLPYIQTDIRGTAVSEAISSPLNMASLQSTLPMTLPERTHPRQPSLTESAAPQRQLPPLPSPAQTTRNVVDQMQDQRLLRSGPIINGHPASVNDMATKSSLAWNPDTSSGIQSNHVTEASSSELVTQIVTSASMPSISESSLSYLPSTTSVEDGSVTIPSSQSPTQLNFTASSLLEAMTAPTTNTSPVYSNFREVRNNTTTSPDSRAMLVRASSETNVYSFGTDKSSKRSSPAEGPHEHSLVSGHHYTPFDQVNAQQTASLGSIARESLEARRASLQRASLSNLGRPY